MGWVCGNPAHSPTSRKEVSVSATRCRQTVIALRGCCLQAHLTVFDVDPPTVSGEALTAPPASQRELYLRKYRGTVPSERRR